VSEGFMAEEEKETEEGRRREKKGREIIS